MAQMSTRIQIISRTSRSATSAAAYRSGTATRSAVSAAAYRAGEKMVGHDGTRFDYTHKGHIDRTEIMAPEGSPAWVYNRQVLWEKVDAREKRKDAQLAREFRVMLPREFTPEQRIEAAREWVQKHFVGRGMIADICWHNPPASDGGSNPHFHVMLPMRPIVNGEFGNKTVGARINKKRADGAAKFEPTTDWNDQRRWKEARDDWAVMANRLLAEMGSDIKLDPRSYQERGIEKMPQPYLGVAARMNESDRTMTGRVRELSERVRGRLNQWAAYRANSSAWALAQKALEGRLDRIENGVVKLAELFDRFTGRQDRGNDQASAKAPAPEPAPSKPPDREPDRGIDL